PGGWSSSGFRGFLPFRLRLGLCLGFALAIGDGAARLAGGDEVLPVLAEEVGGGREDTVVRANEKDAEAIADVGGLFHVVGFLAVDAALERDEVADSLCDLLRAIDVIHRDGRLVTEHIP